MLPPNELHPTATKAEKSVYFFLGLARRLGFASSRRRSLGLLNCQCLLGPNALGAASGSPVGRPR